MSLDGQHYMRRDDMDNRKAHDMVWKQEGLTKLEMAMTMIDLATNQIYDSERLKEVRRLMQEEIQHQYDELTSMYE